MRWLLREPSVHFLVLGSLLFLAHRWVAGDPRTIPVSAGTRADVARRFRDQLGRPPNATELDVALGEWKRDEALYREALRRRLDRDDPAVRTVLIEKMRARATLEAPPPQPSQGELEDWLAAHRVLYETPRRYALEWVTFPRRRPADARQERAKFERAVEEGSDPRLQGRPIFGAHLTGEEIRQKFGPDLAQAVDGFPLDSWRESESEQELLLVRVDQVEGGLPPPQELRQRLIIDWSFAEQQKAVARMLQQIVDRYRFEEER